MTATEAFESNRRTMWAMASAVLSNVFLFFLIFGLSATVDTKNVQKQLHNKFAISTGIAMQFLVMPILGYLSVFICGKYGLTEAMGITLLVVTASPGGSYSNWWCSLFNADLALSVAMTTVSSLLSIALLPLNLFVYTFLAYGKAENERGESIIQALDFETIFITLGIVLSAILIGLYSGYRYNTVLAHQRANKLGSISGLLLVIFSIVLSNGGDSETKLWNQHWTFYVATAAPCVIGVVLATLMARSAKLSPPETVAISIECCYQNTGIATSVAITMFSNAEERAQAVAVPLFYGVVEAVVIGLYCVYAWKLGWTKAPANERFCTVLSTSYEIVHDDDDDDDDDDDEGHAAEEVDVPNVSDEEEAAPPEQAAQPQRHHEGFLSRLFGRKRSRNETNSLLSQEMDAKTPQRKRIVSDFTAETTLSLTSDLHLTPQESTNCLPVQTIIEGACEASEHVDDFDSDDEDVEDEESQESAVNNNNNNTTENNDVADQSHESSA